MGSPALLGRDLSGLSRVESGAPNVQASRRRPGTWKGRGGPRRSLVTRWGSTALWPLASERRLRVDRNVGGADRGGLGTAPRREGGGASVRAAPSIPETSAARPTWRPPPRALRASRACCPRRPRSSTPCWTPSPSRRRTT